MTRNNLVMILHKLSLDITAPVPTYLARDFSSLGTRRQRREVSTGQKGGDPKHIGGVFATNRSLVLLGTGTSVSGS